MRKLLNWDLFYQTILEKTEESKIYTRKGDPFEYKVVSDNWHAKRKGTKKWYNISGEDFIEKYQKSICILDKEFSTARTPDAPKRKECQESGKKAQEKPTEVTPEKTPGAIPEKTAETTPEKTAGTIPEKTTEVTPEKKAGVTPEKTAGTIPSSEKPGEQLQKVEESRIFTSNDPKLVDNTILEMVKSGDIYLNYRDDRNSNYVKKADIVVVSKLPISDNDSRILELYFKGAGLEAGSSSLKNQKDNQIKRGDKIHHYKFIPESNECTEDVPLKEDNHLSYFLHFYYAGQLKKRGLFGLGKRFKLKGVEVSPETLKKVEEFAGALIYKPAVKYVEKEKSDNQTNQPTRPEDQQNPTSSTSGSSTQSNTTSHVEGKSIDQSTAQKQALNKLKKLEDRQGKPATKVKEAATKSGDYYIYRIDYRFD
jgi:hypothetical protein